MGHLARKGFSFSFLLTSSSGSSNCNTPSSFSSHFSWTALVAAVELALMEVVLEL